MRIVEIVFILGLLITDIFAVTDELIEEWRTTSDYLFDERNSCESTLCINGRIFEFINIAFNDYAKDKEGNRTKIQYYSFFIY